MAAGAWTFTAAGRGYLNDASFAVGSGYHIALVLTTAAAYLNDATTWASISAYEHANAYGYTTNGIAITTSKSGTTTVTVTTATAMVWTATSDSIVARYAVVYKDSGNVLCYCALVSGAGSDVTITSGNTLTLTMHASGTYTLA